jgi:hypothetical protein
MHETIRFTLKTKKRRTARVAFGLFISFGDLIPGRSAAGFIHFAIEARKGGRNQSRIEWQNIKKRMNDLKTVDHIFRRSSYTFFVAASYVSC